MNITRPNPIIGVYERPFWKWVQKHRLHLQRCANSHFRYPPGPVCPQCLSADFEWAEVSPTGTLISWTVFHRQYFPDLPVPYTVVSAALSEGPLLIANLVGPASDLQVGMPLRLVFEETQTADGPFTLYQWTV